MKRDIRNVPLISKERLEREIASGRPIWQARREHRARERAAKKRLEDNANARRNLSANQASEGPLFDTDPQEGGQALDDEMARRARAELKEFRTLLKTEASSAKTGKSRPPDSDRRRKLKKQRRKEKKRNKKDDAERDSNHAIAHLLRPQGGHHHPSGLQRQGGTQGSEASFSPGTLGLNCRVQNPAQSNQGSILKADFNFWSGIFTCFTSPSILDKEPPARREIQTPRQPPQRPRQHRRELL